MSLDLGGAAPGQARALVAGQGLPLERDGGWVKLRLPRLDTFEAIVLE